MVKQTKIIRKSHDEIMIMVDANRIVAQVLQKIQAIVEPGVSTSSLDHAAEEYCRALGSEPAFKGYRRYPGSLCVSINEEVVHGIPSNRRLLKEGDIVSLDFGVRYKGYYGDSAITLPVGEIGPTKRRLLEVTRQALQKGITSAVAGKRVGDISKAIQQHVEKGEHKVVRQFVGHGIGRSLHEEPQIPNFYGGESTAELIPGMVLAIEPMVNLGTEKVKVLNDGWTVVTKDGRCSAHFEHSVAVTEDGPLILSKL